MKNEIINEIIELKMKKPQTQEMKMRILEMKSRSKTDRRLALGICGGLGEYTDSDLSFGDYYL